MPNEDVRQALYNDVNTWLVEIEKNGEKFLGGNKPNLADLAVFGVLSSIEGCAAFKDVQKNTKIDSWFSNMKAVV